jgi:hypothetical protein
MNGILHISNLLLTKPSFVCHPFRRADPTLGTKVYVFAFFCIFPVFLNSLTHLVPSTPSYDVPHAITAL